MSVVREIFPEKKGAFENLSLSAVTWGIEELSEIINETLQDSVNSFIYWSVALDKRTDFKDQRN